MEKSNIFKTWYGVPRTRNTDITTEIVDEKVKRTTIITTDDKLLDSSLKTPITAKINPEGVKSLLLEDKSTICVGITLILGLHRKQDNNCVSFSLPLLSIESNCSERSVTSALKRLEELKLIRRLGKQRIQINANLAWFGNQVDWALALHELTIEKTNDGI